jgi:alpha-D-ribose 1-methylphosphonate 5-triphosphate synthase subunit PhnG
MMNIPRKDWPRALATQPENRIDAILADIGKDWIIKPVQLPQTGLAMLQLCDSAYNEPYFLGEIPLATAWVEITAGNKNFQGAARLMDDDQEKIEKLAVCDAVLANQLPGWQRVYDLVEMGMSEINMQQKRRNFILKKTRVDFDLLGGTTGDEDD